MIKITTFEAPSVNRCKPEDGHHKVSLSVSVLCCTYCVLQSKYMYREQRNH